MHLSHLLANCILAANTISAAVLPTHSIPVTTPITLVPAKHSLITALTATPSPFYITTTTSITTTSTTTTIKAPTGLPDTILGKNIHCLLHADAPERVKSSAAVTTTPSFPMMPLKLPPTVSTRKHKSMATDVPVPSAVYPSAVYPSAVYARSASSPEPTTYRWPSILCEPMKERLLPPGFICLMDPAKGYFEIGWFPEQIYEGKPCSMAINAKLPPTWICIQSRAEKPTLERGVWVPRDCSTHKHASQKQCDSGSPGVEPMDDNGVLWDMRPSA